MQIDIDENIIYCERRSFLISFIKENLLETFITNDGCLDVTAIHVSMQALLQERIISAYKIDTKNVLHIEYRIFDKKKNNEYQLPPFEESIKIDLGKNFIRDFFLRKLID